MPLCLFRLQQLSRSRDSVKRLVMMRIGQPMGITTEVATSEVHPIPCKAKCRLVAVVSGRQASIVASLRRVDLTSSRVSTVRVLQIPPRIQESPVLRKSMLTSWSNNKRVWCNVITIGPAASSRSDNEV